MKVNHNASFVKFYFHFIFVQPPVPYSLAYFSRIFNMKQDNPVPSFVNIYFHKRIRLTT